MPNFAFVFPGQGSQAVGMLNGFADNKALNWLRHVTRANTRAGLIPEPQA